MNRTFLEQPFTPAQIKQRKGRNGVLDYVEGHSVIQRLNDALEGEWSFEVVHHDGREDEVLVLGRLSAGAVVKMTFGASQVTREKVSGKPLSLGDDLKAAATDALKKCSTFFGVGLHLYAEKPLSGRDGAPHGGPARSAPATPNGPPRPPVVPRPPAVQPPPAVPVNGNGASSHGTRNAATERQLDAIVKIGRAKGLAPTAVESMSLRVFNRKPGALTREEASTLIKELTNLKRSA
ncbi:MAG: hypothetical protein HYU41_03935 [Candidatus Rokubacteria bacterium]|nr:hypothetical protein [Candidatus Rokubacteria bacterium]